MANTIIQGSNTPITITFSESTLEFTYLHIDLVDSDGNVLKHWTLDEVTRDDDYTFSCPLTQDETVAFPEGVAILEIKWMEDGVVEFAKQVKMNVVYRYDKHILGADNGNS